ncbi:hypothetical protein DH2020_002053 [Rehmannia glutinosa]|uniref:WD repeat-containing protein n=1 Tax=Rehmannia glutinosa TaxID=99300 RepID=A0ABR0XSR0_REHGL
MGSYGETEEDQFFDTRDDISSVSDLGSDCSEGCLSSGIGGGALGYEFWTKRPVSVNERRDKFLKLMGLSSGRIDGDEEEDLCYEDLKRDFDRLMDDGEAVLANLDSEPKFLSSRSLPSFRSHDTTDLVEDGATEDNQTWKIKNLDNGTEFVMDELAEDGSLNTLREVGSNKMISLDELQKTFGSSTLVQQLLRKESKCFNVVDSKKKVKSNWLQRFSAINHISERTKGFLDKPNENNTKTGSAFRRVRVNVSKKHSKELSALYTGQEFPAHEGSILTMKFSHDGQYLASAGVDGVVRVWKVLEDDIVNKFNAQDMDPSGLYFSRNHVSKENTSLVKSLRRSSDSASIVLPPKVFQLSEKPLHEFHGHKGEVLALSWSKNGLITSVNLAHVFSSNVNPDAVTCIEFNPVDDNHFISGSIDGKLRIWEVHCGRVIDWTDIREIVTAVCYCPDGKGGVVGSMEGNCRFYDVIGNRSSGSQVPASFTSGGEHVVSVSEDSNVRVWNYTTQDQKSSRPKNLYSCESFLSRNASVAIPWGGLKNKIGALPGSILGNGHFDEKLLQKLPASFPDCFTTSLGFFLDALYKGSATWPKRNCPNRIRWWLGLQHANPNSSF